MTMIEGAIDVTPMMSVLAKTAAAWNASKTQRTRPRGKLWRDGVELSRTS